MMAINQTEKVRLSDVLKYETDQRFCREEIEIDASDFADTNIVLKCGMILEPGTDTAMKKQVATAGSADSILLFIFAASDPNKADPLTEYTMLDNTTNLDAVVLTRGPSIVDKRILDYNSKTEGAVNSALADENILVRVGPTYTIGAVKS